MTALFSLRRSALAAAIGAAFLGQAFVFADRPLTELAVGTLQDGSAVAQVVMQEGVADQPAGTPPELASPLSTTDSPAVQDDVADRFVDPVPSAQGQEMAAPSPSVANQQTAPYQQAAPYQTAPYQQTAAAPSCNCCKTPRCSKEDKEAATAAMKSAYAGVFYANKFGYLNDPCYDGPSFPGDSLKGLLGGKLDIGGEARVRYHNETNHRGRVPGLRGTGPSGLGLTTNDDNFTLTRIRLFANFRVTENIRLYGEYLYADSGGEFFNNRPIEENRGEMQNLFFDAKLTDNMSVRIGRQEILLGAQRLISPLDFANTRRSFQGARGTYTNENWTVDGFFLNPLNRTPANESKIDDANEDIGFYGVYATRKGLDIGTVDAYYLGLDNDIADFNYQTIGGRVVGKTDGGLLYETEAAVQFGENSPGLGDHSAGFFTGGLGRQLTLGDWKPTVWFWYDWASGEENFANASRGDNSFDQLFPLGHKYLGFIDLFGRRNIQDFNMQFITPVLGSKVKLLLWYHYFRLDEQTTPYDIVGQPYNTNTAAGSKELGHEIDVLFNITLNPRNSAQLGYSFFSAGDYYDTTAGAPNNDAQFFYAQFQTRF